LFERFREVGPDAEAGESDDFLAVLCGGGDLE
jgi:hypothetical protein